MKYEEEWKDVKGFEEKYQISNYGRLKNKLNNHIYKNTNKNGDYFSVVLTYKNKSKSTRIHRLVAEAFIPNPDNLPQVNHIDMNKQNNNVDNLEWCTLKYNINEAIKIKPQMLLGMIKYNKNRAHKNIYQYSLDNKFIRKFKTIKEAHNITGVCKRNILQVCNKEPYNIKGCIRKQAGGYIWKFKSEVMKDVEIEN